MLHGPCGPTICGPTWFSRLPSLSQHPPGSQAVTVAGRGITTCGCGVVFGTGNGRGTEIVVGGTLMGG
jgi:hypothetical protein